MTKQKAKLQRLGLALLAASAVACGSLQGTTPGRAGTQQAAPYDATHIDAGNVDKADAYDGSSQNDSSGPQLVP